MEMNTLQINRRMSQAASGHPKPIGYESQQPRGVDGEKSWSALRYMYFIQVNEEVLRTMVDVDPYDDLDWG